MTDPLSLEWEPEALAAFEAVRAWSLANAELNQHLAAWTGLPTTDANALGNVVWAAEGGEPLSPAQLARRIGMTSGATTVLLNRLEAAGHVVRTRESTDRRRVTLRPSPEAREAARAFTAFSGQEIAATLREAAPSDLRVVADFMGRLAAAATAGNARLQERDRA